jgi:hypothetical protein
LEATEPANCGVIMTTFNAKVPLAKKLESHPDATVNHEGSLAFKQSPKMELYTRVATCLWGQDKFYVTGKNANADLQQVLSAVIKEDPEFVLKLAAYTRNKLFLRAVPQVLLAEVFNQAPGEVDGGYEYVPKVVKRADEVIEVLAYQLARNAATKTRLQGQKKIPKSLQKGLRLAMQNFNAYQYTKYDKGGEVTFKDALSLVRPRPKDEAQAEIFKTLVSGEKLPIPNTWEYYTTIHGSSKASWEHILPEMPIMSTIRNLRNFLEHDVGNLDVALAKLRNSEIIAKSKQLPFRFYSAMREVEKVNSPSTSKVVSALSVAMDLACVNVPKLPGRTCVMIDLSGSMDRPISVDKSGKPSTTSCRQIASVFGGIAARSCEDGMLAGYGQYLKWIPVSRESSVLDNVAKIDRTDVGIATYAHLPVENLAASKVKVDRFINFSDEQCYSEDGRNCTLTTAFLNYRRQVNPNAKMYSIDLLGYGTVNWPKETPGVYTIAGWSNSIFNFIEAAENGSNILNLISEDYHD